MVASLALVSLSTLVSAPLCAGQTEPSAGRWRTWVISSASDYRVSPPPADQTGEIAWLRDFVSNRDATAMRQIRFWNSGSPNYRWVELAFNTLAQKGQLVPGPGNRALALLNVAIYDAMVAAWDAKYTYKRARPSEVDPKLSPAVETPSSPSYPSEHAVAAGAASAVLSYLFPDEAGRFNDLAEEAARSRLFAGVQFPSDTIAGLQLGRDVAAKVIERARTDGSDAVFTGSIPAGPDKWKGTNPAFPMAGTWKTWVLSSGSQFRPGPPPAIDSPEMAADLAELKLPRTPDTARAAYFWMPPAEGVFLYWYDNLAKRLFEEELDDNAPRAARAYAALAIAHYDAFVACWDTKYTYWMIRPSQLDPAVTILFPVPNHPSYPSGHSTMAGATSEILAFLFPNEAASIRTQAEQSAQSRVWAGIHYPADTHTGLALGRSVAGAVLERLRNDGSE